MRNDLDHTRVGTVPSHVSDPMAMIGNILEHMQQTLEVLVLSIVHFDGHKGY